MKKTIRHTVSFFPFPLFRFRSRNSMRWLRRQQLASTCRVTERLTKKEAIRRHDKQCCVYTYLSEEEREKGRGSNVASTVGRLPYSSYERGGWPWMKPICVWAITGDIRDGCLPSVSVKRGAEYMVSGGWTSGRRRDRKYEGRGA